MSQRLTTKWPVNFFFGKAVRHVILFALEVAFSNELSKNVWSNDDRELVYGTCASVEHLFLIGDLMRPPLLPMLQDMRPTRLTMMVDLNHPQLDFSRPPSFETSPTSPLAKASTGIDSPSWESHTGATGPQYTGSQRSPI
ncbi:hypothetical protein C8R43DRAFT_1129222 [Mycena crocata]|nr:hypothetical protein C8R43DRAFT_1129222 [Mycena crocata]